MPPSRDRDVSAAGRPRNRPSSSAAGVDSAVRAGGTGHHSSTQSVTSAVVSAPLTRLRRPPDLLASFGRALNNDESARPHTRVHESKRQDDHGIDENVLGSQDRATTSRHADTKRPRDAKHQLAKRTAHVRGGTTDNIAIWDATSTDSPRTWGYDEPGAHGLEH